MDIVAVVNLSADFDRVAVSDGFQSRFERGYTVHSALSREFDYYGICDFFGEVAAAETQIALFRGANAYPLVREYLGVPVVA
jgi:hypothetical protein